MNKQKLFRNILFAILMIVFSCKNGKTSHADDKTSFVEFDAGHAEIHQEMEKISAEFEKFDKQLVALYEESEKNPEVVIKKADSLLVVNKNENDKYKSQIKKNIKSSLDYLKAELYYKLGQYENSISELEKEDYKSMDYAAAYAANYVKLKQLEKAKSFVDSIGKGFYIYDYVLGNYNEVIGNKKGALKIYGEIKNNKEIKHYAYYKWAVARFEELNLDNPKLLNETYFPTKNPNFDIADSDNENRKKIFDMIFQLPEAKNKAVWIYESPQINDKDYYWIKVGKGDMVASQESFKTEFNFYIYPKNFDIKFFDEKNNKLMTLEEWRKNK